MAYDLEEQEQIATLRAFWNKYGNFILTVVTVVLLAVAAYRGWGWYQARQAAQASVAYGELVAAFERKDVSKVRETAGTIFERYGSTTYGQMAALLAAKVYYDSGDLKAAKAPLQWAVDKARDQEFRSVARVRLAGLLLDEKAYDEALALLPADGAGPYAGEFADRRGDVLVAQGKVAEARAAYRLALEKLDARSPLRRLVQIKLDGIAGEPS
ncbi:MAG: tetratricopeptide repeat protein [Burkholderiaceae bacterium]|nr:tetratricopeptide repeat protein [Burkholderiaceae bacterium]